MATTIRNVPLGSCTTDGSVTDELGGAATASCSDVKWIPSDDNAVSISFCVDHVKRYCPLGRRLTWGSARFVAATPFRVHATGLDHGAPGDCSVTTSIVLNRGVPDCPLSK